MHPYRPTDAAAPLLALSAELERDVLARHAAAVDSGARFPEESVAALGARGLFGLCVPRAHGGRDEGMRTFAAVVEELATGCASTSMIYVMHVAAAQAIASGATLRDRDALLDSIASGKHLTTLAFSERGSRSQFWAPVSRLAESNGSFHTRAEKSWVTSAGHADSYVSSALKPGAQSPLESTVYLVRRGAPGVAVRGAFDGLGLRGNESSPVTLEDVAVAKDDLISPLGEGATTMLTVVLPWFSVGTAAMANGLARAALATTIAHVSGATFEHTGTQLRD